MEGPEHNVRRCANRAAANGPHDGLVAKAGQGPDARCVRRYLGLCPECGGPLGTLLISAIPESLPPPWLAFHLPLLACPCNSLLSATPATCVPASSSTSSSSRGVGNTPSPGGVIRTAASSTKLRARKPQRRLEARIPESLPSPWLPPPPSPQASPSGCYDGGWKGAEGCVMG